MSKVCIIGNSNLKHISLISLYTDYFDEHGISYDIIYIDRYGKVEKSNAENLYPFNIKFSGKKINKILNFFKFRKFSKKIVKENEYEYIITWQSTIAYILFDFLLVKYRKKYIINIRDYIMENNIFIKLILKCLVKNALFTTISSEEFTKFLPKGKYIFVNSINEQIKKGNKKKNFEETVKIGFVGNCRFFDENFKLINSLKNDRRFELWYCGTNSNILKEYASQNRINNVYTMDSFNVEDTEKIMTKFDIINSAFGNDKLNVKTLLPIRLYTAINLYIPILANDKTYLSKIVNENQLGFVINSYENLANNLYNYMKLLEKKSFEQKCDQFMIKAKEQNKNFYMLLDKTFKY